MTQTQEDCLDPNTERRVRFLARCQARRNRDPEQAVASANRLYGFHPGVRSAVLDEMDDYYTGQACDAHERGGSRH